MSPDQIWDTLTHPFRLFADPAQRLSIYYMVPALLVAVVVWAIARLKTPGSVPPLWRWLMPRDVLWHPSARADYVMFLFNKSLLVLIYASIYLQSAFWFELVSGWIGPVERVPPSLGATVITTLVVILAMDFMLWFAHFIFHKVPVLWEFHKVHHSAEVMTPITAVRMHPVEEVFASMMGSIGIGVAAAVMDRIYGQGGIMLSIFGLNIVLAIFFLAAFNLRHSHVWVRYPYWMQHVFISPAQHQIHHSRAVRHWDKNLGFVFGFWDWAAGTLYAPRRREEIVFGLGNGEDGTWNTARALYFRPFRNAYMLFRKGWRDALIAPPISERRIAPEQWKEYQGELGQHKAL